MTKRVKITWDVVNPSFEEVRLGITGYEMHTDDPDGTLVSLRQAEQRGEVTNIKVEE